MGQTRPTEVFCYYAEETVEKNILDLAARKGLSLYTTEKSQGTLDVAPAAMAPDAATNVVDAPSKKKDQKGDFIFKCVRFFLPSSSSLFFASFFRQSRREQARGLFRTLC